MSTHVDLSEQELAELKQFTKQSDPAAAIRAAMVEYLRLARRMELKAASGRVRMKDSWQSLEAAELRERNGGSGSRAS